MAADRRPHQRLDAVLALEPADEIDEPILRRPIMSRCGTVPKFAAELLPGRWIFGPAAIDVLRPCRIAPAILGGEIDLEQDLVLAERLDRWIDLDDDVSLEVLAGFGLHETVGKFGTSGFATEHDRGHLERHAELGLERCGGMRDAKRAGIDDRKRVSETPDDLVRGVAAAEPKTPIVPME